MKNLIANISKVSANMRKLCKYLSLLEFTFCKTAVWIVHSPCTVDETYPLYNVNRKQFMYYVNTIC